MNINLGGYFKETISRFLAKSPKYFTFIKIAAVICASITGLPALMEANHLDIPSWMTVLADKTAAVASGIAWLVANLPVANATTLSTQTTALPFTENHPVPKEASIQSVKAKKKVPVKSIHHGKSSS